MVEVSLKNKTGIVTGAVQGIGRAIAVKMAEAGCTGLTIFDLQESEKSDELLEILKSHGCEAWIFTGDVSRGNDFRKCIAQTVEKWGRMDFLVNNAGFARSSDFFTATEEQWDKVINVNLSSVFYGMKYAAEYMKENGGGVILNMSSISGVTGGSTGPDYGASKAGVIALTKYGAKSLSQFNIRVVSVAPGTIETEMIKRNYAALDEESLKKRLSSIPMGRMGSPEEVGNVVTFLVSDLGSYVNGETVMVTGGRMS